MPEEQRNPAPTISLILGGVAFAAILILFGSVIWGIIAGAAAFGAGMLIFTPEKKEPTLDAHGLTEAQLKKALWEGHQKVEGIKKSGLGIRDLTIRRKIDAVVDVCDRILQNIKEDPKDLRRARQFFGYYLDATQKIVERYATLSRRGTITPDIEASLAKTASTLDTLKRAFEKQLALLLEDDVMDLDTELELLERTIRMEGLAEDER